MPFLVTMICLGCSSTGRERIRAATSSAVFHFANYREGKSMVGLLTLENKLIKVGVKRSTIMLRVKNGSSTCPRRFWPAHTDVWMILRNSWPVLGLKMKMAPLIGFVVKLPSKVCGITNGYNIYQKTFFKEQNKGHNLDTLLKTSLL